MQFFVYFSFSIRKTRLLKHQRSREIIFSMQYKRMEMCLVVLAEEYCNRFNCCSLCLVLPNDFDLHNI